MLSLYAQGETMEALAGRFDVSRWTIRERLQENGIKLERRNQAGPQHFAWRGGRTVGKSGYVRVWVAPDDPLASMRNSDGYVLEHRLVMARALGRPLRRDESVHHLDGERGHNVFENLQLRRRAHGNGVHGICLDCGSHNIGPAAL